MQRIGVHIVRLAPGRESTQFHYHDADEEFLYVLEGRGIAEIGDESIRNRSRRLHGVHHTVAAAYADQYVR